MTDMASTRFVPIWVYANGGDKDRKIYFVHPARAVDGYTTVANARAETPPDLSSLGWSQEAKLIQRIIVTGAGVPQTAATTDDLRMVTSLPSGGTPATTASAVGYSPTSPETSTNVQAALDARPTVAAVVTNGGSTAKMTTAGTAPSTPSAGDIWVDTSTPSATADVGGMFNFHQD